MYVCVPVFYDHINYPEFPVKLAVRCSMSYPFAFEAIHVNGKIMVDGGLCQNYAIDFFPHNTPYETIGFNLLSQKEHPDHKIFNGNIKIDSLISYAEAVVNCLVLQNERCVMTPSNWNRTIPIQTGDISPLEFSLTVEQKQYLLDQGRLATEKFFNSHF